MIKAVFFDWFSTLAHYDPPREQLQAQVLRELGFTISLPKLQRALVLADKELYNELAVIPLQNRTPEEKLQVYLHHQQSTLTRAGINDDPELVSKTFNRLRELDTGIRFALYDDVLPTIRTLKERRLITGLLTNLSQDIGRICRELGLEPYLDVTISSTEAGDDKPRPAIFRLALERAGVGPTESIHVGDQYLNDVVGARNVGITPVLIDRLDMFTEVTDCPRILSLNELTACLN